MERPLYSSGRDWPSGRENRKQQPREEAQSHEHHWGQQLDRRRVDRSDRRGLARDAFSSHQQLPRETPLHRLPGERPTPSTYQPQCAASRRTDGWLEHQPQSHRIGCIDHLQDRTPLPSAVPDQYKPIEEYDYHRFEQEDDFRGHPRHSRIGLFNQDRWNGSDVRKTNKKKRWRNKSNLLDNHGISHRRVEDAGSSGNLPHPFSSNQSRPRRQGHSDASRWQSSGWGGQPLHPPHRYWPEEESRPQTLDDCYCDDEDRTSDPQQRSPPSSFDRLSILPDSLQSLDHLIEGFPQHQDRNLWRTPQQPSHSVSALEELPQHRARRPQRSGRATQRPIPSSSGHFQHFSSSYVDLSGNRVETFLSRNSEGRTAENSRIVLSPIIQIPYQSFIDNTTTRTQTAGQASSTVPDPTTDQLRQIVHQLLDTAILPVASNSLYRSLD